MRSPHQVLEALLAQRGAARRGAAVLPHDRVVQRPPLRSSQATTVSRWLVIPTARQRAGGDAGGDQRLVGDDARHVPDLRRVVLDPARPREVLRELAVGAAAQLRLCVEHEAGRAGRALVDRENHRPGTYRAAATGRPRMKPSELAAAVHEPGSVAPRGPVLEVELHLLEPQAGADRVHRHPDLHPEARRERQQAREPSRRASRADPRSGRAGRVPTSRRIAQRANPTASPKPPPCLRAKTATARSHRPDSTASASGPRRAAEAPRSPSQKTKTRSAESGSSRRAPRRGRHRIVPCRRARRCAAAPPRPRRPAVRCRRWSRRRRPAPGRRGTTPAPPRRSSAIRSASSLAVTITTAARESGGTAGYSAADLAQAASPTNWRYSLADVEAHITGTVWKIEVAVGDSVDEGDTVVILESMKMEMPVEAEDAGTVKEISVEEGQAVSEGDTLVVLE